MPQIMEPHLAELGLAERGRKHPLPEIVGVELSPVAIGEHPRRKRLTLLERAFLGVLELLLRESKGKREKVLVELPTVVVDAIQRYAKYRGTEPGPVEGAKVGR
jgi:hypothetical protein